MNKGDIIAMDRAYIDYEKLETLTQREVMYVTKMSKETLTSTFTELRKGFLRLAMRFLPSQEEADDAYLSYGLHQSISDVKEPTQPPS